MAQRYCEGVGVPTMLGRLKRWLLAMLALPLDRAVCAANCEASAVSEGQAEHRSPICDRRFLAMDSARTCG